MKLSFVLIISLTAAAVCFAKEVSGGNGDHGTLSIWGEPVDPDEDCNFFTAGEALLINVPGSERPHDLAAEIKTTNAPRVLREVSGDFTMQVRVDGRFEPGAETTKAGRTGYNGAGIVVLLDERNTVTLARAALQQPEKSPAPYANFEIRVDGKLKRIGSTGDRGLPKSGPVYLRLERRGTQFLGAVSTNAVDWKTLAPKDVPEEWPNKLQAGVIAISTSKQEFNPRFSKLQVVN